MDVPRRQNVRLDRTRWHAPQLLRRKVNGDVEVVPEALARVQRHEERVCVHWAARGDVSCAFCSGTGALTAANDEEERHVHERVRHGEVRDERDAGASAASARRRVRSASKSKGPR